MGTGNSFGAKKILRLKENFGCNSLRERERDIQRDRQSINRERKRRWRVKLRERTIKRLIV